MVCKNCDPSCGYPGKLVRVDKTKNGYVCSECGAAITHAKYTEENKWDSYFHRICESVSSKSPCLSRKIGALLVRDHSIVSTGYNGPPRGVPHCGYDRIMKDKELAKLLASTSCGFMTDSMTHICPRKVLGYKSGTHMELCPAQHAETNAISNAARLGVSILNTTLYMNCVIPCKNCFGALINAGIKEIVVDETTVYDKHTQFLIDNSGIVIRSFNH